MLEYLEADARPAEPAPRVSYNKLGRAHVKKSQRVNRFDGSIGPQRD